MTNDKQSRGELIADAVVSGMGSWRFIIIQTAVVFMWIACNVYFLTHPFDPFPFILLNLGFSTQAAYASPLILMAGNRSAKLDAQKEELRIADEQAQMARIEALEQKIDTHVDSLHALIREIHSAIPGTGCEFHAPSVHCAQCEAMMKDN